MICAGQVHQPVHAIAICYEWGLWKQIGQLPSPRAPLFVARTTGDPRWRAGVEEILTSYVVVRASCKEIRIEVTEGDWVMNDTVADSCSEENRAKLCFEKRGRTLSNLSNHTRSTVPAPVWCLAHLQKNSIRKIQAVTDLCSLTMRSPHPRLPLGVRYTYSTWSR